MIEITFKLFRNDHMKHYENSSHTLAPQNFLSLELVSSLYFLTMRRVGKEEIPIEA
jgi:hypothetical protein